MTSYYILGIKQKTKEAQLNFIKNDTLKLISDNNSDSIGDVNDDMGDDADNDYDYVDNDNSINNNDNNYSNNLTHQPFLAAILMLLVCSNEPPTKNVYCNNIMLAAIKAI